MGELGWGSNIILPYLDPDVQSCTLSCTKPHRLEDGQEVIYELREARRVRDRCSRWCRKM